MIVPVLEAAMDFKKLSADVCNFIIEVHKENGKDYPMVLFMTLLLVWAVTLLVNCQI